MPTRFSLCNLSMHSRLSRRSFQCMQKRYKTSRLLCLLGLLSKMHGFLSLQICQDLQMWYLAAAQIEIAQITLHVKMLNASIPVQLETLVLAMHSARLSIIILFAPVPMGILEILEHLVNCVSTKLFPLTCTYLGVFDIAHNKSISEPNVSVCNFNLQCFSLCHVKSHEIYAWVFSLLQFKIESMIEHVRLRHKAKNIKSV